MGELAGGFRDFLLFLALHLTGSSPDYLRARAARGRRADLCILTSPASGTEEATMGALGVLTTLAALGIALILCELVAARRRGVKAYSLPATLANLANGA